MSKVVIKECGSYSIDELTKCINEGMGLIGGFDKYVKPGMKVLLKVNLIGPKTAESAAVTHSEFVRVITRILISMGCIVWIGDSAGGAIGGVAPTAQSLEVSGLNKVALEEGAVIKNFDKEGVVEVRPVDGFVPMMHIAKPIFDADFVINLPKFKTHTAGIYTGAVKNQFGLIPGLRKAEYHKMAPDPRQLGEVIADINKITKVGLHIMDGVTAMQGEGPTAGEVYNARKILISTDPLALDTVAVNMIGLGITDIPILEAAIKKKVGESDIAKIEVDGDYKLPPRLENFKIPKRFANRKPQSYKILVHVINFLKTRPKINKKVCKKCNMCVESCPVKAIDRETKIINYDKCIECMCCHELCQYKAVDLKRDNALAGILTRFGGRRYK